MRQLEGHEASVLTLSWQGGGQLVTGSSDGLVKVSGELGIIVEAGIGRFISVAIMREQAPSMYH